MKLSYIKSLAVASLLFSFTLGSFAQSITHNPYSRFGLGLDVPSGYNRFAMSGESALAASHEYMLTSANPASLPSLRFTDFEASATARISNFTEGGQSSVRNTGFLDHMVLAFPLAKVAGASIGIKPTSAIGYNYTSQNTDPIMGRIQYKQEGTGGLNEAFVGAGYEFGGKFSIGAEFRYIFGNREDKSRIRYIDQSYTNNALNIVTNRYSGIGYSVGAMYKHLITEKRTLSFGVKYKPDVNLTSTEQILIRTYVGGENSENFKDTVLYQPDVTTKTGTGGAIEIGVAYEEHNHYLLYADYILNTPHTNWDGTYKNGWQINAGAELLPNVKSFGSFFNRLRYRLYGNIGTSSLVVQNNDLKYYGINFGLSVPLRKAISTLNVAVGAGQFGNSNLLTENYISFHFGATINDKWFLKRKYN